VLKEWSIGIKGNDCSFGCYNSHVAVIHSCVAVIHSRSAVINSHEIFHHQILCIYDFSIQGNHLCIYLNLIIISLTSEYWELSLFFRPPSATSTPRSTVLLSPMRATSLVLPVSVQLDICNSLYYLLNLDREDRCHFGQLLLHPGLPDHICSRCQLATLLLSRAALHMTPHIIRQAVKEYALKQKTRLFLLWEHGQHFVH